MYIVDDARRMTSTNRPIIRGEVLPLLFMRLETNRSYLSLERRTEARSRNAITISPFDRLTDVFVIVRTIDDSRVGFCLECGS